MSSNKNNYITLELKSGSAYIRADRVEAIKSIDTVIFDCDGVLIDIRESYNRAISRTVVQLFEWLVGYKIPETIISDEMIFLFRRSGGFNSDWDIVYGALMFLLCKLPEKTLRHLSKLMEPLMQIEDAAERLFTIREKIHLNKEGYGLNSLENITAELREFTALLDATGAASVDRAILDSGMAPKEVYETLKNFLVGSGKVGGSIIATAIEEIFCGSSLFEEMYGAKPKIYFGRGMVENGKLVIKRETLERLSLMIGKMRFGIASGSKISPAKYILGDLLKLFNPKAQIFLDNIEEEESRYAKMGLKVNLKKPNSYSLLESARGLEPFNMVLYVGDSMEDAIMVREAVKKDPRFLFAGVYEYTGMSDKALKEFLKFECDLILPSVNDIPDIIEAFR